MIKLTDLKMIRKKRENWSGIMIAIGIGRSYNRSGDASKRIDASMKKKGKILILKIIF